MAAGSPPPAAGPLAAAAGPIVWRNYDEVFDLAATPAGVFAACDGGLLRRVRGVWTPVRSPSALRAIEEINPLTVRADSGRYYVLGSVALGSSEAWKRSLGTGIELSDNDWDKAQYGSPPPGHVYALLSEGDSLLAGTSRGLYRGSHGLWARERTPSKLPLTRPNGIAQVGNTYVVGGMGGLYLGRPGAWQRLGADAIRQVVAMGGSAWVVHGNGALDKVEPALNRVYPDLLHGSTRRAWTCCVAVAGSTLLFGGQGGWCERGPTLLERYPPELAHDVVLCMVGGKGARWVGTEQSGVLRFDASGVHRWNPGNGLSDTWVTALQPTTRGLVVGTMHSGLFLIAGDRAQPLACPTKHVTAVAAWRGGLLVGGMNGAWMQRGSGWSMLPTGGEETTSIRAAAGRFVVTTAAGVFFIPLPLLRPRRT